MPRNMTLFHDVLGHNYADVETLIADHTHLNLHLIGLPPHRHLAQYERLLGNHPGPNRLCKLPPLCSEVERSWKQCPACIEQQLDGGFTFIQRELAFIGLAVCPFHGEVLRSGGGQMDLFDKECTKQLTREQTLNNQEFGKRAAFCMMTAPELSGYRASDFLSNCERTGWMENGRFHINEFVKEFSSVFGGTMGHAVLDCLFSNPRYIEAALRAMLRSERGIHPLWCIQFTWFIELRQRKAPNKHTRPPSSRRRPTTPTAAEIERYMLLHKSMTGTAKAMDIDLKRLCSLATRYDIAYSSRPKVIDAAMHAEIMRAYDNKVTPQIVATQFGISLSTAYAQLTTHKGKFRPREELINARTEQSKFQWVRLRTEHPEKSTTALRQIIPGAWKQLESKAADWLKENRPERRIPKTLRRQPIDPMLEELLLRAWSRGAEMLSAPSVKPIRNSGYRLLRETGVKEPILRGPQAPLELLSAIENHTNFVKRRLRWAFPDGYPEEAKLWFLAKSSGVRESSIKKVLDTTQGNQNHNEK